MSDRVYLYSGTLTRDVYKRVATDSNGGRGFTSVRDGTETADIKIEIDVGALIATLGHARHDVKERALFGSTRRHKSEGNKSEAVVIAVGPPGSVDGRRSAPLGVAYLAQREAARRMLNMGHPDQLIDEAIAAAEAAGITEGGS